MKRILIICSVLFTFHIQKSFADQLTVYAYPAPLYLNWMNPSALTISTYLNSMVTDKRLKYVHSIGHLNFDLDCKPSSYLPDGAKIVTGQTSSDDSSEDMIKNLGYGMGAVLTPTPGKWEAREDIERDFNTRYQRGSISFIQFDISPQTCARVNEYLKQYKERNLDQIYGGLQSRPRYSEGGGCSAFAVSVMEIAGVMRPEFYEKWQHHVYVPNQLIGGPTTGQFVPVEQVLKTFSWGEAENSYDLTFWDPYKVHRWIQAQARLGKYNATYRKKAPGLQIDATHIPTPSDPFWLQ